MRWNGEREEPAVMGPENETSAFLWLMGLYPTKVDSVQNFSIVYDRTASSELHNISIKSVPVIDAVEHWDFIINRN